MNSRTVKIPRGYIPTRLNVEFQKSQTENLSQFRGRQSRDIGSLGPEPIGYKCVLKWMWVKMEDLGDHRC